VKQQQFESQYQRLWQQFENMLDELESNKKTRSSMASFPASYRAICSHYAMASERRYSSALCISLHTLAVRGQRQLYRHKGNWLWRFAHFLLFGFPGVVWRQRGVVFLGLALFWLPALAMGLATYWAPDSIYMVTDSLNVAQYESMYDPANEHMGRREARASDSDFAMFGFYIMNNVGVGFRTFAGGILLGLGSIYFLVFNGIQIGGVAGYLSWRGYIETFWGFVAGHSSFELTAICICGAAGLLLGKALWMPGRQRRLHALRDAAQDAIQLLMGGMLLLVMAAFVEAYWSPMQSVPVQVKYLVGGSLWILLLLYFALAGGWRESR
jgi:uncharacterized membrane protein SpoIIM required for sporulation